MSVKPLVMVCVLSVVICRPGMSRADEAKPGAGRDLAAEVREVFSATCARCHGPDLAKPRAGFGYVLDLRRLAADAEKIVPSKPDESGLWQMVHNEEMPPPDSPTGALSAKQKEVIRAWIAAGGPVGDSAPAQDTAQPNEDGDENERPSSPLVWRALLYLGKFHLLLVHFPIALLFAAAIGELWAVWKRRWAPSAAVRYCLALAAVSAVPVVALGWLYALGGHGAGSPALLAWHRWLGTIAGAWAVVVAVFSEVDARRGVRSWRVCILLLVGALLVGVAAHFGGLMANGKDFYDW